MDDKERIASMIEAMMELARGNFEIQVKLSGDNDDLDALAMGLNMMIDDVKFNQGQLQQEIEDRKQAEKNLAEQRNRLNTIFSATPDLLVLLDADLRYQAVNPAFCRFVGKKGSELIGKTDFDVFPANKAEIYRQSDLNAIKSGKLQIEEKEVADAAGNKKWLQVAKIPVVDKEGKPAGLLVSARDITERRQAEEREERYLWDFQFLYDSALEFVELVPDRDLYRYIGVKLHQLVRSGLVAVASYDEDNDKFTNRFVEGFDLEADTLRNLFGMDPTGMKFTMPYETQAELLIGEMKRVRSLLDKITDLKMFAGVEKRARKLLGFEDMYIMGLARKERLFGFVLLVMPKGVELADKDVVETFINQTSLVLYREWAERKMREALSERELLLKEVHHRVKNNLQVVSSLLNLQAGCVNDEKAVRGFVDSRNRIESMALIHEKLYRSGDLAKVNFSEYVNDLTASLFSSYGVSTRTICLDIDIGEIYLSIDRAIPLALIINELVSNSLQHAFPQGRKGKISIAFKRNNDSRMTLTVRDDGVGLPQDVDFKNSKSMGLRLVNMLAEQLKGSVELDKTVGSKFNIRFMLTEKS